jgi:hypothetical protein
MYKTSGQSIGTAGMTIPEASKVGKSGKFTDVKLLIKIQSFLLLAFTRRWNGQELWIAHFSSSSLLPRIKRLDG